MRRALSQLSLEFYKHAVMAEDRVSDNEFGSAEGHRLIAEAIHILKISETNNEDPAKP
jgi:hypothetical protein